MKLICQGLDLSEAAIKVSKALPQRSIIPALEGIKLVAKNDTLTLSATDTELTIQITINADVLREGEALIPGKIFTEYVRKLTNEQIELTLNDSKQILIRYTDSEGVIQCLDMNEYPSVRQFTEGEKLLITEEYLKEAIEKVIFAVATDDSRPSIKGVLFEIEEYTLTTVGLDGYRMSLCKKPLEKKAGSIKAIVPPRSLNELARLLDNSDNIANVYIDGSYMSVDIGHTYLSTKLLTGDFIQYRQILPTDFKTVVELNKAQFETALDRTSILSRTERNNLVKFDVREGIMTLSSNSEIGNIKENLTINLKGEDITVSFNAKYFADCLRVMDNEFIKIKFTSPVTPCIMMPCETDELTYLVLPVRTMN